MDIGRDPVVDGGRPVPPRIVRDLAQLAGEALAAGLFVALILALATFAVAAQAQSVAAPSARDGLLFKRGPGEAPSAAPLLFTDVHIDVSGMAARTTLTQRFHNPTGQWQEGVYVFPLPEMAAIDHLEMLVGARRIEGQIKERQQAKDTFEQAKREGRKAALIEQERPNVFTASVAHIGPNEDVIVTIEYQQTLRYDQGAFRLRFPMVVAPRYVPGTTVIDGDRGDGWGVNTAEVPDAERITPPVAHPDWGKINPVNLTVALNAGFKLSQLDSPSHAIKVTESADHRCYVELDAGVVPADRDFELAWTPDIGSAPGAALFSEQRDGKTYALMMILPPAAASDGPRLPREATFIIDTSGSMEGASIVQAKAALLLALDRLQPGDRFNVIEFNSVTRALFTAPMPVDRATLDRARAFVTALNARGGTEMKSALQAALSRDAAPGYVRQVVFLTDGAVGNESELLTLIEERLRDRRLFTIGIGSAPNSHFLTKAAKFGRGTFTFIGDVREVAEKMGALFRKLESPVLTDIAIDWPGHAEAWPRRVPDLYAGEPVVVAVALDTLSGEAVLNGQRGGQAWRATLPLSIGAVEPGIGVLWAREKIEALTDALKSGAPEDQIRRAVIDVALAHHLVSKYTSLVAVDVTPTAPPGTQSIKTALPTNLPAGMSYDAVFGGVAQTATSATLQLLLGLLALALAALAWRTGCGRSLRPIG